MSAILLLGNPALYAVASPVQDDEVKDLPGVLSELRGALLGFRRRHGTGKAIAAPQIGIGKRIIYLFEPGPPRRQQPL
jgi:peptide deformylase